MQSEKQNYEYPGFYSALQHWGPLVFLSLLVNFSLLKLFAVLIAITEPVATEKSRLNVHLVQPAPQEQIMLKKRPEPAKLPEPEKQAPRKTPPKPVESIKPVVKPSVPKSIVQTKKPQPPSVPEKYIELVKLPNEEFELPAQEQAKVSEPEEEQRATTLSPQALMVADVVPLFRLTRMPKVVNFNSETLKRFYPEEERDFGKEATVEAMILIDENGDIVEVDIIKSAGARFDAAAKKVLLSKALVIRPGYIGDKPVASRVPIPITFNLTD